VEPNFPNWGEAICKLLGGLEVVKGQGNGNGTMEMVKEMDQGKLDQGKWDKEMDRKWTGNGPGKFGDQGKLGPRGPWGRKDLTHF